MMNRRKKIANKGAPRISLTPLIDTAFTLLIIFMVTTPMLQNSLKISLPETKNSARSSLSPENVIITVGQNQQIQVGDKIVNQAELAATVKKDLVHARDKIVIIRGDKLVLYEKIIEIVDAVSAIPGVKHVALAAKRLA